MLPIFFSEVFNNCKQIDFFLDKEFTPSGKGKNLKFYITESLLLPKVKAIFDNLFTVLEVPEDQIPSNYGQVIFDADTYEHKYTGYPAIGLTSNQELVLRVGATSEDDEQTGLEIPLFFDGKSYHLKMAGSDKSLKMDIQPVTQNQGTPDEKTLYYLSAKEDSRPKYTFIFPFKLKENTDIEVLRDCWYDGKFELCCMGFNRSGMNITHAFVPSLEDGTFPQTGVLIILKNGYYDEYFDQAQNKTYQSTKWEIAGVSHPNLLVNSYSDGLVPLSTVGQFSASSACAASKCFLETYERLGHPDNFVMPLYILHITGVNMQGNKVRLDWQPKNNGFLRPMTVSPLVKRTFGMFLQEMMPTINAILGDSGVSNGNGNGKQAVMASKSVPVAVGADDEDWYNKAF